MREDDVAGSLIAELADQGELVDDVGRFTLDPAAALAKLRAHQLSDPHGYLLLLVEAGWFANHRRPDGGVRLRCGSDTIVELCCPGFPAANLPDLFAAVFAELGPLADDDLRDAQVLQMLGLAANNALALEPKAILVEVRDADGSVAQLRVDPNGALAVSNEGDEGGDGLAPGWIRFTLVGDGLGLVRAHAERALVRERCRYARYPVTLDGELVSRRQPALVERATVVLGSRRLGEVGYLDEQRMASIWVSNRGVGIEIPVNTAVPGLLAVVEADLPTDLSRGRLVEGPELAAIREAIQQARAGLVVPPGLESRSRGPGIRHLAPGLPFVAVLGLVAAVATIIIMRPMTKPPTLLTDADQVALCEDGDRAVCVALAKDPATRDRARFWRLACLAGDPPSCVPGLPRSESAEEREAMLVRGCIGEQAEACDRLLEPRASPEPESPAQHLTRLSEVCEYGYRPACQEYTELAKPTVADPPAGAR